MSGRPSARSACSVLLWVDYAVALFVCARRRLSIGSRPVSACVCSLLLAWGSMTVRDDIKAKLETVRGGRTLGGGLIKVVLEYLIDVVEVHDVSEFNIKALMETAVEAWKAEKGEAAELPGIHKKAIVDWIASKPLPVEQESRLGGGLLDLEDDADDSTLLCQEFPHARDIAMLEEDKKLQGLTGAQIVVGSEGLELGRVPAVGDVVGVQAYKSDPRLAALTKQQKKAGMKTLSTILAGPNVRRELSTHFGNLVRDYSDMGGIQEASLITRFWAETQSVSYDDKVMIEYISEYLRKYGGRFIPEVMDVKIASRVNNSRSAGGVTPEQLAEVKALAKTTKSEFAELKRELNSLKGELSRLKSKTGPADRDPKGPKCHKCGEFGHIARDCPKKKSSKEDDEEAAAGSSDE